MLQLASLLSLLVVVTSHPHSLYEGERFGKSSPCAVQCPTAAANKFSYQNDSLNHVYEYEASIVLPDPTSAPSLKVAAQAQVTHAQDCEMILSLSHITVDGASREGSALETDLIRNPLRFAFIDGVVETVCPATDEPLWALNFKRGILSVLQNSMQSLDQSEWVEEDDVSGLCSTSYSTQPTTGESRYEITKTRTTPCIAPKLPSRGCVISQLLQALPILYAGQNCTQTISGGVVQSSYCRERLRLPWQSEDAEPMVDITLSLRHVKSVELSFVVTPTYEATRQSLHLQWEDKSHDEPPSEWMSLVLELLQEISSGRPVPEVFYRLTDVLRRLDYNQLSELFVKMDPKNWSDAVNSLLSMGTEPALKLLKHFLEYDTLSFNEIQDAIYNLVYSNKLDKPMIDFLKVAYFGRGYSTVSTYLQDNMKSYCQQEENSCYNETDVSDIFGKILTDYNTIDCDYTKYNDNATESFNTPTFQIDSNRETLEMWSSIGYWNKSESVKVMQCVESESMIDQLGALEAIRSVPCDWVDYDALLGIMKSQENSSSTFQIMMYLTLVRCPTKGLADYLVQKLKEGDISHDTSFIWSHLTNLENEFSGSIISDSEISAKYSTNPLRFSRNLKKAFTLMNRTFLFETNMIFNDNQMRPKYVHSKISSDFDDIDFIEFELKEKNSSFADEMSCSLKMYGISIYQEDYGIENDMLGSLLISPMFLVSMVWIDFSFHYPLELIMSLFREGKVSRKYTTWDVLLQYPTSIGMPLYLMSNCTEGIVSNGVELPSYHADTTNIMMLIDSTHINIGSKMMMSYELMPTLNQSQSSDSYQFIVNLPEKRNTLVDFRYGLYYIKDSNSIARDGNSKLDQAHIDCKPALKKILGSTICHEYEANTDSWNSFRYQVYAETDEFMYGHNLTLTSKDEHTAIRYERIGDETEKYHFILDSFEPFNRIQILTPNMSLNGSGTFFGRKFDLDESGEVCDFSGFVTIKDEVAPFVFKGNHEVYKEKKLNTYTAHFDSDIFEAKVISTCNKKDNLIVKVDIPYRTNKQKDFEHIVFDLNSKEIELSKSITELNFGTNLRFTGWPTSSMDAKGHFKFDDTSYDLNAEIQGKMTCSGYTLFAAFNGVKSDEKGDIICQANYTSPNSNYTVSKYARRDEKSKAWNFGKVVQCDGKDLYKIDGNFGGRWQDGFFCDMLFVVPLENETYPLVKIYTFKQLDILRQKLRLEMTGSYMEQGASFNVTAGSANSDIGGGLGLPVGLAGEDYQHHLNIELKCDEYGSYIIQGNSTVSQNLQDIDARIGLVTPIKMFKEPEYHLKLDKKASLIKMEFTKKKNDGYSSVYSMEGLSDYDILSNLI